MSNRINRNGPNGRQAKKTSPRNQIVPIPRLRLGNVQRSTINQFKRRGSGLVNRVRVCNNFLPSKSMNNEAHGMPDEMYMNLAWSVGTNLQISGAQGAFVFEGNNPWDPDPQLGGTSAQEYQLMINHYRYCKVYGSAIQVNYTCINQASFSAVVVPRTVNVGMTYDVVKSLPRAKVGPLVVNTGTSSARITNDANTAALYGIPDLDYDTNHDWDLDNGESGTTVTEPPRKWYWYIYFSAAASQAVMNGSAEITIVYRCKFYHKRYLDSLQTVTGDGDVAVTEMLSRTTKDITDPLPIILLDQAQFIDKLD